MRTIEFRIRRVVAAVYSHMVHSLRSSRACSLALQILQQQRPASPPIAHMSNRRLGWRHGSALPWRSSRAGLCVSRWVCVALKWSAFVVKRNYTLTPVSWWNTAMAFATSSLRASLCDANAVASTRV